MDAASVINTSLSIVYESLSLNVTACDLEQSFRLVTTVHIIGLYGSRSIALCIVASGQPLLCLDDACLVLLWRQNEAVVLCDDSDLR